MHQRQFNAHLKAYNSRIAAHQYLPAAQSAAAAAAVCVNAHNYDGAFRLLGNFDKALAQERHRARFAPCCPLHHRKSSL